jgi:hypothetical protein
MRGREVREGRKRKREGERRGRERTKFSAMKRSETKEQERKFYIHSILFVLIKCCTFFRTVFRKMHHFNYF